VKKTKAAPEEHGPAERIDLLMARVPKFDEALESFAGQKKEPVPSGTLEDHVEDLKHRLFDRAASVVEASIGFADLEDSAEVPPKEWVKEFGEKEASRRFRIARFAQQGSRSAPVGIKCAMEVFLGILNVDARHEQPADRSLNVTFTQINVSGPPKYPEIEVLDERK
jgi:hypothetical protein